MENLIEEKLRTIIEKGIDINNSEIFFILQTLDTKTENFNIIYNKIIKNQNWDGTFNIKINGKIIHKISPINFLLNITEILKKEEVTWEIFKTYYKNIKKSIKYIEKHFDEHYLLIYKTKLDNSKTFSSLENAKFIFFCDSLTEILNNLNLHTLSDKLFLIKGKIELGFQRYFYYKGEKTLIKNINLENQKIKICKNKEILKIMYYYEFDREFLKEIIKIEESKIEKYQKIEDILFLFSAIKKINDRKHTILINKYKKIINYFPEKIYKENSKTKKDKIKEKIFQIENSILEINKYKLQNTNNLNAICKYIFINKKNKI